ncbi:hypothetical protein LCGC14_2056920 [marine sediment metagenome]|uniref:Uncharacterized protein n=1 Tax=marine sediment metagenome TaxID=412755 RepID=A0A0F9EME9_9ZZZZ
MSNIIEGFKVDVPVAELGEHFQRRIEFHRAKVGDLEIKIGKLKDREVEAKNLADDLSLRTHAWGGLIGGDPVEMFEMEKRLHAQCADYFVFLSAHLIRDTVYRLTDNDLVGLEFGSKAVRDGHGTTLRYIPE